MVRSVPGRHAVAAVTLALLAGCFDSSNQGGLDDGELAGEPFFGVHTVIDPLAGLGEPSLGVAPNGTLYTNGHGSNPAGAPTLGGVPHSGGGVYRSTDDGLTWTRVGDPIAPMHGVDPDLAVDADGAIWYLVDWVGCNAVGVSRDQGETWRSNPASCNAPVNDRPYVIPTSGGTAYLFSMEYGTYRDHASKTTDYGLTWIPTTPIDMDSTKGGPGWSSGGFINRATGTLFLTWTYQHGIEWQYNQQTHWSPGYALTRDGGASWSTGVTGTLSGDGGPGHVQDAFGMGWVTGAADEEGNVYLSWAELAEAGTLVAFTVSTDDGRTWRDPVRLDPGPGSRIMPYLTAGAKGKIAIAYYAADEAVHPHEVTGEWNVTLSWTEDALAANPVFQHGQLSDGPIKRGQIWVNGAAGGTAEGQEAQFQDYFQARVLPDGRVGAVFNSMLHGDQLVNVYASTREPILGP